MSNSDWWNADYQQNPISYQRVAAIPPRFKQGDSAIWGDFPFVDAQNVSYDSAHYALRYVLAGPVNVGIDSTASGAGWSTTLTTTLSATMTPGTYGYQAQLSATGVRVTISEGEVTVEPDLALVGANYDTRTVAEKALEDAQAALAVFQANGGRIQHYTIGSRSMTFQKDSDILAVVNYWKCEVAAEQSRLNSGRDRLLKLRFNRAR